MYPVRNRVALAALLAIVLGNGGCTLVKPVVGVVVGPVVVLGEGGGGFGGCGCDDGCAIVGILAVGSAIGAVCGLVSGIVSDVQAVTGRAEDPYRNWYDPFSTNTSDGHL